MSTSSPRFVASSAERVEAGARWLTYAELTKPGLTSLVLVTTGLGYLLAAGGAIDWIRLLVAIVGTAGRMLRRGAHAVGLGFADRLAGGVAGAAEGALACAVILLGTIWAIGDDDPIVTNSRSMEILEQLQGAMGDAEEHLPSVSSPARWLER